MVGSDVDEAGAVDKVQRKADAASDAKSVLKLEKIAQKAALKAAEKAARKAAKADKKAVKKAEKDALKAARKAEKKARKAEPDAKPGKDHDSDAGVVSKKAPPKGRSSKTKIEGKSEAGAPIPGKKAASRSRPRNKPETAPAGLFARLQTASRLARNELAVRLSAAGLYPGQEQVLFQLDEFGPLSLTEIAERQDVSAPTMTKTVNRMEAQGFLSRATARDDARSMIISMTPEGRVALAESRNAAKATEAAVFEALPEQDAALLGELLGRLIARKA
jgi:DNA-binding MarR family transcriptional regulator